MIATADRLFLYVTAFLESFLRGILVRAAFGLLFLSAHTMASFVVSFVAVRCLLLWFVLEDAFVLSVSHV
jgi:hypothetical protein